MAAVHDGYVLKKSVARAPLGGALLTRCMLHSVDSKGVEVALPCLFRRKEEALGQFELITYSARAHLLSTLFQHAHQQNLSFNVL